MSAVNSRPPSYDEARPFLSGVDDENKSPAPAPALAVNIEAETDAEVAVSADASRRRHRRRFSHFAGLFFVLWTVWLICFGTMFRAVDQAREQGRQEVRNMVAAAQGYPAPNDFVAHTISQSTSITRIMRTGPQHPDDAESEAGPVHFEVCAKLEPGSEVEIPVAVHHGGYFIAGGSFSGVKELAYARAGPVGISPPHKPHPQEPPSHNAPHVPKLPIPSFPKPPSPEAMRRADPESFKPKPPKDHPSPYNVTVAVSRAKSEGSDVFVCAYKIPFASVGVGAFGLVNETIHPLVPSKDASTIEGLSVKVTLPTGFPATAIGLRAPIFPLRPVPAPPETLRITRVTTVVTQRLTALKNRIKGACRGRMMRHYRASS